MARRDDYQLTARFTVHADTRDIDKFEKRLEKLEKRINKFDGDAKVNADTSALDNADKRLDQTEKRIAKMNKSGKNTVKFDADQKELDDYNKRLNKLGETIGEIQKLSSKGLGIRMDVDRNTKPAEKELRKMLAMGERFGNQLFEAKVGFRKDKDAMAWIKEAQKELNEFQKINAEKEIKLRGAREVKQDFADIKKAGLEISKMDIAPNWGGDNTKLIRNLDRASERLRNMGQSMQEISGRAAQSGLDGLSRRAVQLGSDFNGMADARAKLADNLRNEKAELGRVNQEYKANMQSLKSISALDEQRSKATKRVADALKEVAAISEQVRDIQAEVEVTADTSQALAKVNAASQHIRTALGKATQMIITARLDGEDDVMREATALRNQLAQVFARNQEMVVSLRGRQEVEAGFDRLQRSAREVTARPWEMELTGDASDAIAAFREAAAYARRESNKAYNIELKAEIEGLPEVAAGARQIKMEMAQIAASRTKVAVELAGLPSVISGLTTVKRAAEGLEGEYRLSIDTSQLTAARMSMLALSSAATNLRNGLMSSAGPFQSLSRIGQQTQNIMMLVRTAFMAVAVAAAGPLVAGLSVAAASLAGLIGGLGLVAAAAAPMISAFGNAEQNAQKLTTAENELASASKALAGAQNQMRDANANVAKTMANNERNVASAVKAHQDAIEGVQDAREAYNEAVQGVHQAEIDGERQIASAMQSHEDARRATTRAVEDLRRAQQDLVRAQEDEIHNLRQLGYDVEGMRLDQRQSVLDVAEAQERLNEAMAGGDSREIEAAQIDLERARLRQRDLADETAIAERDLQRARLEGTEGLQAAQQGVLDAQNGVNDAVRSEEEARLGVIDAQNQAAEGVQNAQKAVMEAQEGIVDAMANEQEARAAVGQAQEDAALAMQQAYADQRQAAESLAQAEKDREGALRKVQDALAVQMPEAYAKLRDAAQATWDNFKVGTEASRRMIVGLATELLGVANNQMPHLAVATNETMQAISDAIGRVGDSFNQMGVTENFQRLLAGIPELTGTWIEAIGYFIGGLINFFVAALPYAQDFANYIRDAMLRFQEWTASTEGREALQRWFQTAAEVLPVIWSWIVRAGRALVSWSINHTHEVVLAVNLLGTALKTVFDVIGWVTHALRVSHEATNGWSTRFLVAVGAIMLGLRLMPNMILNVAGMFLRMGMMALNTALQARGMALGWRTALLMIPASAWAAVRGVVSALATIPRAANAAILAVGRIFRNVGASMRIAGRIAGINWLQGLGAGIQRAGIIITNVGRLFNRIPVIAGLAGRSSATRFGAGFAGVRAVVGRAIMGIAQMIQRIPRLATVGVGPMRAIWANAFNTIRLSAIRNLMVISRQLRGLPVTAARAGAGVRAALLRAFSSIPVIGRYIQAAAIIMGRLTRTAASGGGIIARGFVVVSNAVRGAWTWFGTLFSRIATISPIATGIFRTLGALVTRIALPFEVIFRIIWELITRVRLMIQGLSTMFRNGSISWASMVGNGIRAVGAAVMMAVVGVIGSTIKGITSLVSSLFGAMGIDVKGKAAEMKRGVDAEISQMRREMYGETNMAAMETAKNMGRAKNSGVGNARGMKQGVGSELLGLNQNADALGNQFASGINNDTARAANMGISNADMLNSGMTQEEIDLLRNTDLNFGAIEREITGNTGLGRDNGIAALGNLNQVGSGEQRALQGTATAEMGLAQRNISAETLRAQQNGVRAMVVMHRDGASALFAADAQWSNIAWATSESMQNALNATITGVGKFIEAVGIDHPVPQPFPVTRAGGSNQGPGGGPAAGPSRNAEGNIHKFAQGGYYARGGTQGPEGGISDGTTRVYGEVPGTTEFYITDNKRFRDRNMAILNQANEHMGVDVHAEEHTGAQPPDARNPIRARNTTRPMASGGIMRRGEERMQYGATRYEELWDDRTAQIARQTQKATGAAPNTYTNHPPGYPGRAHASIDWWAPAGRGAPIGVGLGNEVLSYIKSNFAKEISYWIWNGMDSTGGSIAASDPHYDHVHGTFMGSALGMGGAPMIDFEEEWNKHVPKPKDIGASGWEDMHDKVVTKMYDAAKEMFSALMPTTGSGGPAPEGQVKDWIKAGIERGGAFPANETNIGLLYARAMQESGGDPRAVNNWDSNAAAGTPSKGLMQIIEPTWNQWEGGVGGPFEPNWADPVRSVAVSSRYMKGVYGGPVGATGVGYSNGGIATQPQVGMLGENGPEMMIPLDDQRAVRQVQNVLGTSQRVTANGNGVTTTANQSQQGIQGWTATVNGQQYSGDGGVVSVVTQNGQTTVNGRPQQNGGGGGGSARPGRDPNYSTALRPWEAQMQFASPYGKPAPGPAGGGQEIEKLRQDTNKGFAGMIKQIIAGALRTSKEVNTTTKGTSTVQTNTLVSKFDNQTQTIKQTAGQTERSITSSVQGLKAPLDKTAESVSGLNADVQAGTSMTGELLGVTRYVWGLGGAYAKGGIVTRPEKALVGEAGPEAIIPLEDKGTSHELLTKTAKALGYTVTKTGFNAPGFRTVDQRASQHYSDQGGSGVPPNGWTSVDGRVMTYTLNTAFGSVVTEAINRWNALGGVKILPHYGNSPDVNIVDAFLDVAGRAWSHGLIEYDPYEMGQSSMNGKLALAGHEVGHSLGFPHALNAAQSIMGTPFNMGGGNAEYPTSYDIGVYRSTWGSGVAPRPFKKGGIVRKSTFANIGEAGTEAVMPLTNPRAMQLMSKAMRTNDRAHTKNVSDSENQGLLDTGLAQDMISNDNSGAIASEIKSMKEELKETLVSELHEIEIGTDSMQTMAATMYTSGFKAAYDMLISKMGKDAVDEIMGEKFDFDRILRGF